MLPSSELPVIGAQPAKCLARIKQSRRLCRQTQTEAGVRTIFIEWLQKREGTIIAQMLGR
jgi:hypothetical protein